jgi:predicted GH43/DUF377 family glycosyl hydrolase
MNTEVHKLPLKLHADPRRVITLPSIYPGLERVKNIYKRIVDLPQHDAETVLESVFNDFGKRHKNLDQIFLKNYRFFEDQYPSGQGLTETLKLLLGACLTKEFSIQSAALFNPSMVPHPDQSGIHTDKKRMILSLRSTGEGHISSIEFRTGLADEKGNLSLEKASAYSLTGEVSDKRDGNGYSLIFPQDSALSERVIFPQTEVEAMGMEDLRLVRFADRDQPVYYGTYTAYNGREIRSQLLATEDFRRFTVRAIRGPAAKDKGMALFPEKVKGKYAIISRQGGENMYIMYSDDLYFWEAEQPLMQPLYPFEFSQIGNCGSPIKTGKGWLLLTHGVGPMRQYTIGAALLDLQDPRKVISRSKSPLLAAGEGEREGYVPNVVYSCGSMVHADILYIPYAMSDSTTGFAWLKVSELLDELIKQS